ncbi:phosphotransferase [Methanoculleus taiwanensis]|uniref:Phosphotransferase n=1 Tax=Methanoculleus taiwanensis TaxID=1550565 RepID=A0A498H217_9EURY|nr:PHP-associated domain-containing protein [Methanoculleus taiwanensis]RXE56753.1 phosphotransferase [Methanoculleus taiwanensis]
MNCRADDGGWIRFSRPEPGELRRQGLLPVDLHVHTNHSDSPTRVKDALKLAARQGIGLAITDHNRISGVLEALRLDSGVPVVPGIEISADDGPHILLYFASYGDLREFYTGYIERNTRSAPYIGIRLTTEEILDAREGYPCVAAEAHPCGYVFLNRGVERCIAGECIGEDLFSRLDALEVICGGMARSHNRRAAELARKHRLGRTGGTDAHLLHELGGVVTCASAETAEELLEAILRRETIVIGEERTILGKAVTGTAALPHHLPYTVPILHARWEQNRPRIERFIQSRRTGRNG